MVTAVINIVWIYHHENRRGGCGWGPEKAAAAGPSATWKALQVTSQVPFSLCCSWGSFNLGQLYNYNIH